MTKLIILLLILALLIYAIRWAPGQSYLFKVLYALDVFLSSLVFRDACITISARTGLELRKATPAQWAVILGGVLNQLQPGHCETAINFDISRAVLAISLLKGATS